MYNAMPGDVEMELGVPFPGRVLPRLRWTRTGWRSGGPFDWERVFGRRATRVVDLGCGNGRYLIASALARPDADHLGVDTVQRVIDYAAYRANRRGVANVRFAVGDASEWMFDRLDALDEVHVYHPQPYYDADAASKRLLTAAFLERVWEAMRKGGRLVLQTDNKAYWRYLLAAVAKHFEARVLPGPWPDAPEGRTRREILARRQGLVVWRMEAVRRDATLSVESPRADFDANRPRFRRRR